MPRVSEFAVPVIAQKNDSGATQRRFAGTATIFGDGILITAKHVFTQFPGWSFFACDVEKRTEHLIPEPFLHPKYDIAVFAYTNLWMRLPSLYKGERGGGLNVWSVGYIYHEPMPIDFSLKSIVHKGNIVSDKGSEFAFGGEFKSPSSNLLSYLVVSGMSGGPVLSEESKLVGVMYGNRETTIGRYSIYKSEVDGKSISEEVWRVHEYGLMHHIDEVRGLIPETQKY